MCSDTARPPSKCIGVAPSRRSRITFIRGRRACTRTLMSSPPAGCAAREAGDALVFRVLLVLPSPLGASLTAMEGTEAAWLGLYR